MTNKTRGQKNIKLPKQEIRATFMPESYNEEARTIDVVWTTGAKVKRYSWFDGEYMEELSMKKSDIRLERLNAGAPFLKNHSSRLLEDSIGVVEKAWIKNKEGIATVKLSARDDAQGIIQDLKDGILRNISVGYRIHKMEDVTKKGDDVPTYRAVDWEPMEISLVNIPADPSAQVRSEKDQDTFDVLIVRKEENDMENENQEIENRNDDQNELNNSLDQNKENQDNDIVTDKERSADGKPAEPKVEPTSTEEGDMAARNAEKERCIEIRSAVKAAGLEDSFADEMIKNDTSLENARSEIIKKLGEKNSEVRTNNHNVEVRDVENRQLRSEAFARAILHRNDPMTHKLQDGDREFMGHSLIDSARMYLEKEGVRTGGMTKQDIAKRSLQSTSDFANILADVSNKELLSGYNQAPQTFMPFTRERSVSDFKEVKKLQLSDGTSLDKVNEHGEYKRSILKESKEGYFVEKFGRILGLTWELIVNDDLEAYTDIPMKLGRKARAKESEIIWAIFGLNQVMADGNGLFHASHGNLAATPAAISIASLGIGRSSMRLQKDLDGEILNLGPQYLIVPAALETIADQFVSSIVAADNAKVNPFSRLQVISEGRLDAYSATAWYLSAPKGDVDMIELGRLDGRGPEMFTRETFDVDGMETKIRYVFGAKALDYRGLFKNAGV